jgi:hypothetical protein
MGKKFDLVAVTGTYEVNGETKKRYANCGAVFEKEDGSLSVKIESLPVGTEWNGWLSMYEPQQRQQQGGQQRNNDPFG